MHLPFDIDVPKHQVLHAGKVTCIYEAGALRNIKIGGALCMQMIYGAVRDASWNTAPFEIKDAIIESNTESFSINYTAFYALAEIRYRAAFELKGEKDGTIHFSMKGEALSSFQTNRIGICVLHPVENSLAQKVHLTHPDESVTETFFPDDISPHQPFFNIKELETNAGVAQLEIFFSGDVFETEDQRNWTDFSFKTYSTPLAIPFPRLVEKGNSIKQEIKIDIKEKSSIPTFSKPHTAQKKALSKLGLYGHGVLKKLNKEVLQQLPFSFLRHDVQLNEESWKAVLERLLADAAGFNLLMHLVVYTNEAEEKLQELYDVIEKNIAFIESVLLVDATTALTPSHILQRTYGVLKKLAPQLQIGYGTSGHFAELNRNRPQNLPHDFVTFAVQPQVHASDVRTIFENLSAQPHVMHTIQNFSEKPIHIASLSFAEMGKEDTRSNTNAAAWWLLKSICKLSPATHITLHHPFNATSLEQTPFYTLFTFLKRFHPQWVIDDAPQVGNTILLENATGERIQIVLDGAEALML